MTHLATTSVSEAPARRLSDALENDPDLAGHGIAAEEIGADRWRISVYFEREPTAADTDALARVLAEAAPDAEPFQVEELPDTNWVVKSLEGLAPVRAGRFLVHGAHDRARIAPNDLAIEIEAGLAFGTGHHGTTAGCLLAIDRLAKMRPIRNVLDVGTGSGVLAVAVAKRVKDARIVATDIDPVAVKVARANIRLNGVEAHVATAVGAGLDLASVRRNAPYDLVVANILAAPLVSLAPAIRRALAPAGVVILSGLLAGDQQRRVAAAYRAQGLRVMRATVIAEWATLVMERGQQRLRLRAS